MPQIEGYRGRGLVLLERYSVGPGDVVSVRTLDATLEGTLMIRYGLADDQHIVLKLRNGYNIGINIDRIKQMSLVTKRTKPNLTTPAVPVSSSHLPKVAIISTGGTIASRVDYRTGGVHPALTVEELCSVVPELSTIADMDAEVLFSMYSENLTPEHWSAMALKVAEKMGMMVRGVVLTHGTDTMGYTAAALSFVLSGCPVPVILVGSQRSSDRPSSDATTNLLAATVTAARADFSGVYVAMHNGLNDDAISIHLGTRVRKNHTSRRDAFESVDSPCAAIVKEGKVTQMIESLPRRREELTFIPKPALEPRVALVKFHPGLDASVLEHYRSRGFKGIVLEGTGLGHVSVGWHEPIRKLVDEGVLVGMSSQCIWGKVRMTVYDSGRDLLSLGVIPLDDMLPETAMVKMMWVLGNARRLEEAKKLMCENLAGEYAPRRRIQARSNTT